ncbi:chemotaxis protein CheB [Thiorhodovibrio frisius]|uniref:protein-glutamate O-methyltransferase n=1 Tax=Thiorhodovibrio frisius TaxID=631362 RepID=H8Z5X7_9GAMM|nr:chemotaxis protein CheB [Thiorhodovibrio frisius]EIC20627.1 methylase of chemotaxis methyl-accepting protein [Thiorhodovibrio frisius]WPL21376.1 Chemotaxis protein methyltransferase [Thiorhodovibrio frisius]
MVPDDEKGRYIVAVGASAGGLDALERFFQALPERSGAAYVVIQHLSPDHKSMMANLLARHTLMPVVTVEDGMKIETDRVHLIPPASMMSIANNELRLSPKNPRGLTLPIDLFFTALGREFGKYAIGVVLSGTGSDGTRGAVAINDAGGFLLAQEPETAKFDGMPRSAIATGLVDAILPPEELGPRILDHISQVARISIRSNRATVGYDKDNALEETMHLLYHQGGINFREYKPATVMRRIERRMQVRHVPDLENYARLLDGDRTELNALRRELLIPVTNFFRDPESFETLAQNAIHTIVQERGEAQAIRAWVPATSTGEEAYSIAILFAEAFDRLKRWPNFKLFATDVEQHNVDVGSAGVFSEAITAEVSPERLERWFYKRGNHFVVKNEIRQSIVFARHNLLEDPPFTRMDLVTCRNLLIYFRSEAQERALRRMQYALAPGGFMFLGSSETLAGLQSDFTAVSSKHKIYRILRHVSLPLDPSSSSLGRYSNMAGKPRAVNKPGRGMTDAVAIDAGQSLLLRSYAPNTLLLNSNNELLHVFGDVGRYLRFSEGAVSLDLPKLLPAQVAPVAQALLHKAARGAEPLRSDVLSLKLSDGESERLRLVVRRVEIEQREPYLLLSFEPMAAESISVHSPGGMETMDLNHETADRVETLERELAATRESLQATIEELETANEELQATNEELMASNEELQSSNEELQSVNEELYTVNAENQEKIEILNRLNADLDGMAKAAAIATVFVDSDLRLTRFTPEATGLFKIRDGDLGRNIDDFSNLLNYPNFIEELRNTIQSGEMLQREITASNGRVYLVRVLPYAVRRGDARGAVATFIDVTTLHDIKHLQAVLNSLPESVAVLDSHGEITMVNDAWRKFAHHTGDQDLQQHGVGVNYLDMCESPDASPDANPDEIKDGSKKEQVALAARSGIEAVLSGAKSGFSMEYPCCLDEREHRLVMHVAPIRHPAGGLIISHVDLTQSLQDGDNLGAEGDES